MTIRGSASSFEFRKRLGKERTKQVFRKQAERELAVRQNAVGIELSVEPLQLVKTSIKMEGRARMSSPYSVLESWMTAAVVHRIEMDAAWHP